MDSHVSFYPCDSEDEQFNGTIYVDYMTPRPLIDRAVDLLNGKYKPSIEDMKDRIIDLVESGNAADLEPLLEVWPFDLDLTVAENLEDISQPLMARLESTPTQKAVAIYNNCTFYGPCEMESLDSELDEDETP